MEIHTSYSVKIKEYNHIFDATVDLYRCAVSFFIDVVDRECVPCDVPGQYLYPYRGVYGLRKDIHPEHLGLAGYRA